MIYRIATWAAIVLLLAGLVFNLVQTNELKSSIERISKRDKYAVSDDYLIIGNSIMANADWVKLLGKENIYNTAIPGLTLFEANQYPSTFVNRYAKKIFVELGINDLNTKVPTKSVIYAGASFLGLVRKISPNSKIYVISVLPIDEQKQKGKATNSEIMMYNSKLYHWAKNNHIEYIDAFAVMYSNNSLNPAYSTDGLHLNEEGYKQLAKVLLPYFD